MTLAVVGAAAAAMERWAAVTRARREPVLTPAALALVGQEVTVSDAKARRELGYQPVVSVIDGLADLRDRYHAQGPAGA